MKNATHNRNQVKPVQQNHKLLVLSIVNKIVRLVGIKKLKGGEGRGRRAYSVIVLPLTPGHSATAVAWRITRVGHCGEELL